LLLIFFAALVNGVNPIIDFTQHFGLNPHSILTNCLFMKPLQIFFLLAMMLTAFTALKAQDNRQAVAGTAQAIEMPPAKPQTLTQTVRGRVIDRESLSPLDYATVKLWPAGDSSLVRGDMTDDLGRFEFVDVPVGRLTIAVQYVGYEDAVLPNLLLTTGKQLVLDIPMTESFYRLKDVEIVADRAEELPLNELVVVSGRSFSVEQTNRYAGSLTDPARMASNFAGVATAGDTRNDIVIRGNSPLGMLWRLEGVDIPNPNHYASQNSNGGPISILNYNTLANSDFLTSAFPAEYGNATSGVFDLRMRNGNLNKHEHAFQIGFAGVELMSEGPLNRKQTASYLISYRYSTLAAFDLLGIRFGELYGVPQYQDISFKFHWLAGKAGSFSLWGLGGRSQISILESELSEKEWNTLTGLDYSDIRNENQMGGVGLTHTLPLSGKSYLRTVLAASGMTRLTRQDTLALDMERTASPEYREDSDESRLTAHVMLNHKFSNRLTLRVGTFAEYLNASTRDAIHMYPTQSWIQLRDFDQGYGLLRGYAQGQYRLTDKLTATAGLHAMYLGLNDDQAVDPRAGLSYQLHPKHRLSFGYGQHSQLQRLDIYMSRNPEGREANRSLRFTRAQHLVLGYDWLPAAGWRVKLEGYWQSLDRIPVTPFASSFSAVNLGASFDRLPEFELVSNGTGQNQGLELTVEKFFTKTWYALLTTSLFQSQYTPADGRTYSTAYDQGYVINALVGLEQPLGQGHYALLADLKVTTAGGARYTPLDREASQAAGSAIRLDDQAFAAQAPAYFRTDVRLGVRQNFRRVSHEFIVNLQNVTNHQNVLFLSYNPRFNDIVERYQLGFFPVFQYKIMF
jgi:hypothetical protein